MSIVIIGLVVCVAIAVLIVLLVALPGLRSEGRIPDNETQNFRLPGSWTGFDDEDSVDDLFTGDGDEFEPAGLVAADEKESREAKRARRQRAKAERAIAEKRSEEPGPDERGTGGDQELPKKAPAEKSRRPEPAVAASSDAQPVAARVAESPDAEQDAKQNTEAGRGAEPEYVPRLQSMRHAMPPVWAGRPRTRHWRAPESGEGLKTAAKLLIG
ncbi:hypothetical protein [Spelaeicoccus albus]|uniref:Uncharacterized protein n=1 Tax=Spelaeicoccus albus TaxID=1280376 RepID=A0A7Z0D2M2_9MICO|nr:hypothetical protein [Spelaeicoccus albus]NYI67737.1 hypothetical protein [Spelaeicoccus albus]